MIVARTRKELSDALAGKAQGGIGFVPTMGALHEGHLSLIGLALEQNDTVAVSIFVNPTQFNDPNDLEKYPRTEKEDIAKLRDAGVHIVFIPSVEDIYPEPDKRSFDFGSLANVMEGATRPGHFNGVAQVVSILFDLVKPHRAYFGQKDFQQVAIIKALVKTLCNSVEIVTVPTKREHDGLAMSSRNTLLDSEHRSAAKEIYASLVKGMEMSKELTPAQTEQYVTDNINSNPYLKVIYFNLVDAETLEHITSWTDADHIQGCIAVQAGNVRLIDNIRFL